MSLPAAVPTRGLRGPIMWTLGGNLVYTVSQWACVAVIARSLGPADVGVFALAGAIAAPVLVLTQLQLRIVLATGCRQVTGCRTSSSCACGRWSSWSLPWRSPASWWGPEAWPVIVVFGVAKAFDSVADVLYGYHQRREEMRAIAIGQGRQRRAVGDPAVLGRLVVGFAPRRHHRVRPGSAANLCLRVVPAALASRATDTEDPRQQPVARARLVRLAAPLAVVLLLSAVATSVPRIVLEQAAGSYALGIFAGVSFVVLAAANLVNAVGNALSPRLARTHAVGDRKGFTRVLGRGILFGAGLGAVGAVLALMVGDQVLGWLYGPDYGDSGTLLAALCAVSVVSFTASFLVGGVTAARRFGEQLPIAVVTCAVAVVGSILFIPRSGVPGTVAVTLAAAAVQLIGYGVILRRVLRDMVRDR